MAGGFAMTVTLPAGCGSHVVSGSAPVTGAPSVSIPITDAGCAPNPSTVVAGPVNFDLLNTGAGARSPRQRSCRATASLARRRT